MKSVYVVCKNFNTPNVMFFHPTHGWNLEKVEMFKTKSDAYLICATILAANDVSLEKFVTQNLI